MLPQEFTFDFGISYAGEDREYAQKLCDLLKSRGARVFFGPDYQAELWGKNLYEDLPKVYKSGRFFIPFISHHYASKEWTLHEWGSVQERALHDPDFIIPIRLDDTMLPGLSSTKSHIDLRKHSIEEIAELALEKLQSNSIIVPKVNISSQLPLQIYNLEQPVKYCETIVLKHAVTGYSLHSSSLRYSHPGTSFQQIVTASAGIDVSHYWVLKGPYGQPEEYHVGQAIQHGDVIRLEHRVTGANLHSHLNYPSPLTHQQELMAFGHHNVGDANDNWRVEVKDGDLWYTNKHIRLIHVQTNCTLHSHTKYYEVDFLRGHQEVTCFSGRDDNDLWYAIPSTQK